MTNMKTAMIVLAAIALLGCDKQPVGRFQLLAGTYEVSNGPSPNSSIPAAPTLSIVIVLLWRFVLAFCYVLRCNGIRGRDLGLACSVYSLGLVVVSRLYRAPLASLFFQSGQHPAA
jgi:hypothetical protein